MERIQANHRLRRACAHQGVDPLRAVAADVGQPGRPLGAQLVEEPAQRVLVATLAGPHQPACRVVNDHRQIPVPQRLWLIEATRYNVLPMDDDVATRINPDVAGRPVLIKGNTQLLFAGMGRLSENCVISIKNKSHAVTAEIEVPETGAQGVIIAQGANIGG